MINETYDRVGASPLFHEMVAKRNRFALMLSAIMLIVFYAFVLLASVSPDGFATPVAEGSKWVVGHLFGWGVIVFAFLLTAVYVWRANSEFDAMTRDLIEESQR